MRTIPGLKRFLFLALFGLVVAAVLGGSAAALATGWGGAIEVPGTAKLNKTGYAEASSVSCAAAGECSAGGYYDENATHYQAFVVTEKHRRWGKAIEVPGIAKLNKGGYAKVYTTSCAAAGECAVGGFYKDGSGHYQAFLATQKKGRWGKAAEVPGTRALNKGGSAFVYWVSCAAVGECVAGGTYQDASHHYHAFLVTEKHGRWGRAVDVPGMKTLNRGHNASVFSVSCVAVGQCAAAGNYTDGSSHQQAFVVNEKRGHWGKAMEVPGIAALNAGGLAGIHEVSCSAAGECGAGGYYKDGSGNSQAFVVSERHGHWGKAVEVPGLATLNSNGQASVLSVSCRAAGACSAGGYYKDGPDSLQAFVVNEKGGHWGNAIEVPGTAILNSGSSAAVNSVSCAAAGACVAVGYYLLGSGDRDAFVVSERQGQWGEAVEVPGTATLNSGVNASANSVSCVKAGACAAGGYYTDGASHRQAFVVTGKGVAKP